MNDKISNFKLERWLLGELSENESATIAQAVENDAELRSRVALMKKQDEELFQRHPPDQFQAEVNRRLHVLRTQDSFSQQTEQKSFFVRNWMGISAAVGCCLLLMVFLPSLVKDSPQPIGGEENPTPGYRIKGETIHLMAHLVTEGELEPDSIPDEAPERLTARLRNCSTVPRPEVKSCCPEGYS